MTQATLAFIGAGNMATALIGGMIKQGFSASQIKASDRNQEQLAKLEQAYGIVTSTSNEQAIADADVVILAVKPQVMASVLQELQPQLQQRCPLLISIAAGITCSALNEWSGGNMAVVRCMPNTPALVQAGISGLYANTAVTEQQRQLTEQILQAVGGTVWLPQEQQLDAVTAVSGSGPAYFFLFMEAMINAGEKLGLERATAEQLSLQTALGAALMAKESDADVAELRRRVTSPGGTTEQALLQFTEGGLPELVEKALKAAAQRSEELSAQLEDA